MSRVFWFAAGAASGVYTLVKAKRTAQNFTPDGVAARLAAWNLGARMFKDEVLTGMADREQELRHQLSAGDSSRRLLEEGRRSGDKRATQAASAALDSHRASA
ncbi:MAG: DUF6167 family protein [Nocardioidaceae bacterium]